MKVIRFFSLAMLFFLPAAVYATADWYEYDINVCFNPQLAGAHSARYDAQTGQFLALYTRPGLWLARCQPDECTNEIVDPALDITQTAYLFRDEKGLLALYFTGENRIPKLAREGSPVWTSQPLVLPLNEPEIFSAAMSADGVLGLLVRDENTDYYYCQSEKTDGWQCEERTFYRRNQTLAYDSQGRAHVLKISSSGTDLSLVLCRRIAAGEWEEEFIADVESYIDSAYLAIGPQDEMAVYRHSSLENSFIITGHHRTEETQTWQLQEEQMEFADIIYNSGIGNLIFGADRKAVYTYFYSGYEVYFPDWPQPVYYSFLEVGGSGSWRPRDWSYSGSYPPMIPEYNGCVQVDGDNKQHLLIHSISTSGYAELLYNFDKQVRYPGAVVSREFRQEAFTPLAVAALPAEGGLTPYLYTNLRNGENWSQSQLFTYAPIQWREKYLVLDDEYWWPGRDPAMIDTPEGLHFLWLELPTDSDAIWYLATYGNGHLTKDILLAYPEQFVIDQIDLHYADDLLIAIGENDTSGVHFARRPPGGPIGEIVRVSENGGIPAVTACADGLARIVYYNRLTDELFLATEGDPFTVEIVADNIDIIYYLNMSFTCEEPDTLHLFFNTDDGVEHLSNVGDAWTLELLWPDSRLGDAVPSENGRPIVGFIDSDQNANLARLTDEGWETEQLSTNAANPMKLWRTGDDFIACYVTETINDQQIIQCRSTSPFVEEEYFPDDDTVDDDTIDDDTIDDDSIDDDSIDDDTVDDDTIDDDTVDDDSIDDDTVDDDTIDDDTVDDDTIDDDSIDDDTVDDDTIDDDTIDDDDDDNDDDACGS